MFGILDMNKAVNMLHSTDLVDMREAMLSDDEDGPDGGSPNAHKNEAQNDTTHKHHLEMRLCA
ncbi:MAG: hypothetical protein AB3N15_00680 [Paracoccaceae bacterium]